MRITLIGNYAPDRQQSMLRYARLLHDGLAAAGHDVRFVVPRQRLPGAGPGGAGKWLGYVDKYILSLPEIGAAVAGADVVHVCDHSNAVYIPGRSSIPYTATCHDLIAVRAALGEIRDWPVRATGRLLQRAVRQGLGRARAIACVSEATRADVVRLLPGFAGAVEMVPNALNFDYRPLDAMERATTRSLLPAHARNLPPYLLLVGSADRRKNRATAIRAVAALRGRWDGVLVFAGESLTPAQRQLAIDCGVPDRVIEIATPDNVQLRLLYNEASALLFPSRHEGFGWPLLEAQACGCPVICSDVAPMPQVTGGAALFCDPEDPAAFAGLVLALERDADLRSSLIERGLENARNHSRAAMIDGLQGLFERVVRN